MIVWTGPCPSRQSMAAHEMNVAEGSYCNDRELLRTSTLSVTHLRYDEFMHMIMHMSSQAALWSGHVNSTITGLIEITKSIRHAAMNACPSCAAGTGPVASSN